MPAHVPAFYPRFPASHTFKSTDVAPRVNDDEVRRERIKQRRDIEEALRKMRQEQLRAAGTTDTMVLNYDSRNPFLAPPTRASSSSSSATAAAGDAGSKKRKFVASGALATQPDASETVVDAAASMPYKAPNPQFDEQEVVERRRRAEDILSVAEQTTARPAAQQ